MTVAAIWAKLQLKVQDLLLSGSCQFLQVALPADIAITRNIMQIVKAGGDAVRAAKPQVVVQMGHNKTISEFFQKIQLVGIAMFMAGVPAEAHMGKMAVSSHQSIQIFFTF